MLAVTSSPLSFSTSSKDDDDQMQMQMRSDLENLGAGGGGGEGYCDYFGGNLLDTIDFDDLFLVGINDEDDMLPDLEMDPEILSEFPVTSTSTIAGSFEEDSLQMEKLQANYMTSDFGSRSTLTTQDVVRKRDVINSTTADREEAEKARKSSSKSSKNAQAGKRKVKVDWTPELHRRFVQAVEQLGVDKAVPSRILELMGIDCLTRHNIASHLQKYRSHRKHLLAREAEAANWSKKRQLYCPPAAGGKRDMNTWHVPTIGFPPPVTLMPHFRPLHVWGHPSVHQSLMHVWPKHLGPSPTPPPQPLSWAPAAAPHPPPTPPPPTDPSFWHSHHLHVSNSFTPGTPCFPPHLVHATYPVPPVPGIPPPTMYKIEPAGVGVPTAPARQALSQPRPLDFHPSKESIDAALGDVISKPWLPLPLGLKPPSVDGVMVELQRQGVAKIPPAGV